MTSVLIWILYVAAWLVVPILAVVLFFYYLKKRPKEIEQQTFEERDS